MRRSLYKKERSFDFEVCDDEQDTLRGKIEILHKNQVTIKSKHRTLIDMRQNHQGKLDKKFYEHKQKSRTQINSTPIQKNRKMSRSSSSSSDVYDIVEIDEDSQNLKSNILTKYKNSYFNEKIKQFNESKQKYALPLTERYQKKSSQLLSKQFSALRSDQLPYGINENISLKRSQKKRQQIDELYQIEVQKLNQKDNQSIQGSFGSGMSIKQSLNPNITKQISLLQNRTSLDMLSGGYYQQRESSVVSFQGKCKRGSLNESNYTIDVPAQEQVSSSNFMQDELIQAKLIEHIYLKNIKALNSLLIQISKEYKNDILNIVDHHGNTPLFLAVKLSYISSSEYFEIIKMLLIHGADPTIADKNGWSPIEESIAQSDILLASCLFDYIIKRKERELQNKRVIVNQHLMNIEDFYLEMKWEFTSSFIPFFSKLAPNDIFKLTKKGTSLRLDSTFAGLKNYRAKRRNQSLIYNPLCKGKQRQENQCHCRFIVMLNRTKQIYFYPIQEIDPEEKKQILLDLLNCDSVKGRMKINSCKMEESKNLLGNVVVQNINGWTSKKYNLKIESEKVFIKKSHQALIKSYEEYMMRKESSKVSFKQIDKEEMMSRVHNSIGLEQLQYKGKQEVKKKLKNRESFVYISKDYPLRFQQFLPILSLLGQGNELIQQLEEILQREEIKKLLIAEGFPIKIEIPVSWAVEAVITFEKYQIINEGELKDQFDIDDNLKYQDRKIASKTSQRDSKRLLLANLYI